MFIQRLKKEDFDKHKIKVAETITEEFKLLFKIKKSSREYLNNMLLGKENNDNKKFMGFVNGLLKSYGVKIVMVQTKVTNKTKYLYKLEQNDQIKIYYKYKT
jgi:hypothetical protein